MIRNKIITGNIGEDSISIISLEEGQKIETIYLKSFLGDCGRVGPWDMKLTHKGQLLILNSYDESLMTLDLSTKNIHARVKLSRTPVCISVFESKIYILNCDSNSLSILDEDTLVQIEEIYLEEKPTDLQIDIRESKAYIANSNGNSISIFNLIDNTMEIINISSQPFRLLISKDYLYILSYINNGVINYCSISSIDLITKEIKENKIKGIFTDFAMFDENLLILTNPDDGYLYNYNLIKKVLTKRLYLGGMPNKIILEGKNNLYVTDLLNNCVLVINLKDNRIIEKIRVGKEPQGFILL